MCPHSNMNVTANIDGSDYEATAILPPKTALPTLSDLTKLLKHGGASSMVDAKALRMRFCNLKNAHPRKLMNDAEANLMADQMAEKAKTFFYNLVENAAYNINTSLISYLTLHNTGVVYSATDSENPDIPTAFTFVGQFIDHDLTLNMIDLIGRVGNPGDPSSENIASPLIDLDSVYGGRSKLTNGEMWDIINNTDGAFKLRKVTPDNPNGFDLPRRKNETGRDEALIFDKRNDENQLILQIHILIMRLHNKLIHSGAMGPLPDPNSTEEVVSFIMQVKQEVVRIWQSFIWEEYLEKTISPSALQWAKAKVQGEDCKTRRQGMPHEFSIGFRMGHSQLRNGYQLNKGNRSELFQNQVLPIADLRGDRLLTPEHVIDWPFFISPASNQQSNLIDTHITKAVFDLPETTIPDNVKGVGNLPQRNLMRSEQVKLACGEDLATHYGLSTADTLPTNIIEAVSEKRPLFQIDNNGNYAPSNRFRTPLWFYVLKEAEHFHGGRQLGPVGGRIIGEVIAAAVWCQPDCFLKATSWTPKIPVTGTGVKSVRFADIIAYVTEEVPELKVSTTV